MGSRQSSIKKNASIKSAENWVRTFSIFQTVFIVSIGFPEQAKVPQSNAKGGDLFDRSRRAGGHTILALVHHD